MYPIQKSMRPAISMIELIFAIVIIGITLMSAPQLINVSIQSSNTAMQQEAIAAAASQISLVLTRHWDEQDSNSTTGYGILQVTNRANRVLNDFNMSRRYNIGTFSQATGVGSFGTDVGDSAIPDDIDDFNTQIQQLQLYAGETASLSNNEGEYIDAAGIYTTTTILYGDDTTNYASSAISFNNPFKVIGTSSNIKLITVRIQTSSTEEELKKDISLHAFSCNVGTPTIGNTQMQL